MAKKTVNLKEVIEDINAGMHDNQLMVKHELSPGQLAKVMEKLEAMGQLQRGDKVARAPATRPAHTLPINCPNCRALIPAGSADCPKCGIVVSKYQQTSAPSESAEHRIRSAAGRSFTSPVMTSSSSKYLGKLISVGIIAVLILILYGAYRWFKSGMDAAVTESHSTMVRTILKEVDEGEPDYFKLAKKLQHTIGYDAAGRPKQANGSPQIEKLGEISGTLLELGGLEGNLRLREQAQGRMGPRSVRTAGSRRLEAEGRLERLQSDMSNVEAALSRAREVAADADVAARVHAEQMARDQGYEVVSHRPVKTVVDGEDVQGLEQKRQQLMDKINSESAKMTEIEEPTAAESPEAAEPEAETLDALRERLEATQEKLVALCNEYLTMVGQSPDGPK